MSTLRLVALVAIAAFFGSAAAQEPPAAQPAAPGPAEKAVPIEAESLEDLLAREIRGGEAGSFGAKLAEFGVIAEVHGYLSAELKAPAVGTTTFDLHHSVLNVRTNIRDVVFSEVQLEWEHAGSEFYIPLAMADLKFCDALVFRVGYLPVPLGSFNEYQYPDPMRKTVQQPLVTREIVPVLWADVGIELRGKFDLPLKPNYAVYLVNGLEQADKDPKDGLAAEGAGLRDMLRRDLGTKVQGAFQDKFHSNKAFGGRIGINPVAGLDLGASAYTGIYTVEGGRRLNIVDVDLHYRRGDLLVRAEGAVAFQEVTDATLIKPGGYVMVAYRVGKHIEPYVLWDTLAADGAMVQTRHRLLAGTVVYPFPDQAPNAMVKVEGAGTRKRGGDVDWFFTAQFVVGF